MDPTTTRKSTTPTRTARKKTRKTVQAWPRSMNERPRLLITMGDVAGVGPEIIARAWPELNRLCRPVVVGDPAWLAQALALVSSPPRVCPVGHPAEREPDAQTIPCLTGSDQDLGSVQWGQVSAAAGKAA